MYTYVHVCACEMVTVISSAAVVVSPLPAVAVYHKNINWTITQPT